MRKSKPEIDEYIGSRIREARLSLHLSQELLAVKRGALISYTFAFDELIRQPISYIDRILKGESPKDLPIQAPTKYELAINLKTAKAMGLDVPPMLLTRADEVIE